MAFLFLAETHVSAFAKRSSFPHRKDKCEWEWDGDSDFFLFIQLYVDYTSSSCSPFFHFAGLPLETFGNGYNKYHKEGFPNKACGRCRSHIWWQATPSSCFAKSIHSHMAQCVFIVTQTRHPAANTHFYCQTQIFTLSHVQTLSHCMLWYSIDTDGYS